jgi:hypothetical protein
VDDGLDHAAAELLAEDQLIVEEGVELCAGA